MDSLDTNTLFSGILLFGYLVIALFFLRFWMRTRDRLFAMFSGAFGLLAVQRIAFALSDQANENLTILYVVRLLAFVMILAAIVDKNRAAARDVA